MNTWMCICVRCHLHLECQTLITQEAASEVGVQCVLYQMLASYVHLSARASFSSGGYASLAATFSILLSVMAELLLYY